MKFWRIKNNPSVFRSSPRLRAPVVKALFLSLSRHMLRPIRSVDLINILAQSPQHLGHAPRLGKASARTMRRIALEDFRYLPEAGLAEMRFKSAQNLASALPRLFRAAVDLHIRADKRSQQPRPDRALMIAGIAAFLIALIMPSEIWIGRTNRRQSKGG